jgi:uncharacterized repeat protein (TIGR01451 family)
VTWNLGTKNPGDTGTISVTVAVANPLESGTVLTNTATFDTTETDPVHDTAATTVQSAPSLTIVKTNNLTTFTNPGKTVTYTVTVTNAASATNAAKALIVTDALPAGFIFVVGGGSTKPFAIGDLAPGKSATITYEAAIAGTVTAGTYTNTAKVSGSNVAELSATSNVEVRIPFTLGTTAAPKLKITKTVNVTTARRNDTIQYTITVKNIGDAIAENVTVKDTLPTGLTDAETGKTVTQWTLPTLAVGESQALTLKVKVGDSVASGKLTNTATASATNITAVSAKASVTIIVPQVLGLATTGPGLRDYLIMAFGLILLIGGIILVVRNRRTRLFA